MTRNTHLATAWLCVLATVIVVGAQDPKWSRQLDAVESTENDSLDWVPLAQPLDGSKDRSGNGRVLTYSQSFPPNGRFAELAKATHASAGGAFDFPFQFPRYSNGLPQAQPLRSAPHSLKAGGPQEPTSQSFFKFEMPFRNEAGGALRAGGQVPPTLQTGYQIQHSFGGAGGAPSPLFNPPPLFGPQQSVFPPEFHTLPQKPLAQALSQPHKPLHQQNYVDDILPLKTHPKPLPTQSSLQSVTPQVFPVDPAPESLYNLNKAAPATTSTGTAAGGQQQQEVQLLYVPYDTLYNQQRQQQQPQANTGLGTSNNYEVNKFNLNSGLPAVNPYQINQFYTQDPSIGSDFFSPGTTSRPTTTTTLPNVFQSYVQPQLTTAKPKPKAHQPPLAMFLLRSNSRPTQSDVVTALRNAHSISVIDAPTKQTPDIFVGPAGMPIPDGYVKFDLPYLSQLAHSRDLSDIPFFVAPLSYRTPNGFNKILLPEPHVGSIVVNRAKDGISYVAQEPARPQRPLTTSATSSTRNPFETTTQPQRNAGNQTPGRGNKFSYFYVQDAIQEVTSPKISKQERPKKKRPQNVQVEQPTYRPPAKNPFETINQIGQDDFFSSLIHKPSTSTSTSTSTTSTSTSTTSTTQAPPNLFTYSTSPQVEFPSTNGQLYPQYDSAPQVQSVQEHLPRFTTRPPPVTSADEEYRMKQYFRQQDAFRQRPHTTNPPFEQVQYTPNDSEREVSIPTTTPKLASKGKQRVNIYTPAAIPVTTSDVGYNVDGQKQLPLNHRPSYNQNEVLDSSNLEYEPNPYHVPSELPALTPDIPGLVNNLQEKDKLAATTTPMSEQEVDTRPTRRPLLRTRKPLVSKVVTSSVSYSESETSSKLPTHRIRRPYGTRVSSSANSGDNAEESATTTRRPNTARNPLLRNPNRIRYQPTTEERQSLKLKPKKHYTGSKKTNKDENQDLEYQRDVLKQNYPIFKGARRPTSPTAIPSSYDVGNTEGPASESQQVYTVTPSNSIDNSEQDTFPANLLEPMQIAQHYNEFSNDNYGPGYFPNQEDISPTEAIVRNEVNPVYTAVASTTPSTTTTTTTLRTTTETPTTTRRSPFIRRNYPRLRTTTTTEQPLTTTTPVEERPSIRARLPPRRVIKVRQRTRRPSHPASSTAAPEEESEPVTQKQNLRKLSRYNQEQRDKETTQTQRRRYKQPFQLEGQESQWSPATETSNSNDNSFIPLNPKEASKTEAHSFENEPEIVTIGPTDQADTYEFNVGANLGGSADQPQRTTIMAPNLKPEKSFAELLEEVMGKAPEELAKESASNNPIGRLNRRGKWKKTRLSGGSENAENFETAESQNLGPQLLNALYTNEKSDDLPKTTTPLTPATEPAVTTTVVAPTTPEEYEVTTAKTPDYTTVATTLPVNEAVEETATRRMDSDVGTEADDLDTQPSIFSEVKKQLHDLFAIEEDEDQAASAALAAVSKRRQEYTSIKRTKPTESTTEPMSEAVATTAATPTSGKKDSFHKNLMEHVVYATSTSTKVTSETEICYRGRCIRSEDLPANHKLH